ncbi:MAG TPA: DUF2062 domain-containing protein [Syntrophales bacterium]|nr:DUF2062 domain-containing protein [Syntrophales bacterium]HPI56934.1 DUF2062 domain-containing protein [Syntrophales bacterium]HPN23520.1 DUF2062 domain-containing protein [Syntrophales bacterium]HQM27955.1 DUF2062 domain-containing protein [Syntrophales bacterium]
MKDRIRDFYSRFISLKGAPGEIAAGMAIGVFIGVTPTIPFHTVAIIFLCLLFRQNMTAALLGATCISNPLTIPVFYLSQYELGRLLLNYEGLKIAFNDYSLRSILELGWHILYPLQVGGLLMAAVFTVPAYFITYRAVAALRSKYAESAGHTGEVSDPSS